MGEPLGSNWSTQRFLIWIQLFFKNLGLSFSEGLVSRLPFYLTASGEFVLHSCQRPLQTYFVKQALRE